MSIVRRVLFAVLISVCLLQADPITAGDDYLRLRSGLGSMPLPADFFAPGSDPFIWYGPLQGVPLGGLHNGDTIIRRPFGVLPFDPPAQDTIPIEIVALHLVSVNPISVTYSGGQNPEPWVLDISLIGPSSGTMDVLHTNPQGGIFHSVLQVTPRFTFTRLSDMTSVDVILPLIGQYQGTWMHTPPAGYPNQGADFVPISSFFDIFTELSLDLEYVPAERNPAPPIPEPATLFLLGSGMMLLASRRRSKN